MAPLVAAVLVATVLLPCTGARAQSLLERGVEPLATAFDGADAAADGTALAPLASLVVPGSGQLMQKRRLGAVVFAALEAVGLWLWSDARSDGRHLRGAYRELAYDVARARSGPPVVSSFDYYERMSSWERSGRFDADPALSGVQPERDLATWNGQQWRLAVGLHLAGDADAGPEHPGWEAALTTYGERAYPDELAWDWSSAPAARRRYRDLIAESDDRFRVAGVLAGAVVANHVVSAVEAFVARRTRLSRVDLGVRPDPAGRTHIRIRVLR